jgi:hypothetical protein
MPPRKKFLLRIQPQLWEELERWAAQEFRSINGQIEFLLQRAVSARLDGSSTEERGRDRKRPRRE